MSAVVMTAVPQRTSAIPYKIEGYLKDSKGLPITLATVSISGRYWNDTAQGYQTQTFYAETDINGYFRYYVAAMEPGGFEQGTEMTVAYSADGVTVSTMVAITGLGSWANLTYEDSPGLLDALVSPIGLMVIVAISAAAFIGFYIYRSGEKDELQNTEEKAPKRVERRRRR